MNHDGRDIYDMQDKKILYIMVQTAIKKAPFREPFILG